MKKVPPFEPSVYAIIGSVRPIVLVKCWKVTLWDGMLKSCYPNFKSCHLNFLIFLYTNIGQEKKIKTK